MAAASEVPPVPVKVEWCGDRRRLRLPGPVPNFEALQTCVWKLYEHSTHAAAARAGVTARELAFTYTDEDDDVITVSSQLELDEAVRLAPGGVGDRAGLLRLSVAHVAATPLAVPVVAGSESGADVAVPDPVTVDARDAAPPPPAPRVAVDVHPALVALGQAVTGLEAAGLSPADAVDMARLAHALHVSPKVFFKLGLLDKPSFRAWKAQHWYHGGLVAPPAVHGGGSAGRGGAHAAPGSGRDGGATHATSEADSADGVAPVGPRSSSKVRAARFTEHVTYGDEDMVVFPGAEVRKIWRVMNDSGAPWPAHVGLVSTSETGFGAQLTEGVGGTADGEEAAIVADVVCPTAPGRHRGVWRLFNVDTGRRFGSRLWMTVVVGEATGAVSAEAVAPAHGEMPPPVAGATPDAGVTVAGSGVATATESEQPPA